MAVRIAGKQMHLWRAVDSEGEVLDVLVQRRRAKAAALKLMRKLLRKQGFAPAEITTDRLRSYGAAFADFGLVARRSRACARTTGPRCRTSHSADGSAKCSGSTAGLRPTLRVGPLRRLQHVSTSSAIPISRRPLRAFRTAATAQWRAATAAA